jgi:hypothetical protein
MAIVARMDDFPTGAAYPSSGDAGIMGQNVITNDVIDYASLLIDARSRLTNGHAAIEVTGGN